MTTEERAFKTNAIINTLAGGKMIEFKLKELTDATHNDLSFVEEQGFVSVKRSGLANSTIMYSLTEKGRDVCDADGLLKYTEVKKIEKAKAEDKSQLEEKLKALQADEFEYKEKLRKRNQEIENLQTENLKLSIENYEYKQTRRPEEEQISFITLLKGYWWLLVLAVSLGLCAGGLIMRVLS